jgi:Flp pilus assembly protein TadD
MLDKIPTDYLMRVYILAAAGRVDEARKYVKMLDNSDLAKNSPFKVACAYALVGDKDTAVAWLEKAYAVRQADLVSIKIDPAFAALQNEPRYQTLVKEAGLGQWGLAGFPGRR